MNITPKHILDTRSSLFSLFGKEKNLSQDLVEYILDFTIYSINLQKERYNNVLREMIFHFNAIRTCGTTCLHYPQTFYCDGFIFTQPKLRRSTHATCLVCDAGLSTYSCSVCEKCADPTDYPDDYDFYHKDCLSSLEPIDPLIAFENFDSFIF